MFDENPLNKGFVTNLPQRPRKSGKAQPHNPPSHPRKPIAKGVEISKRRQLPRTARSVYNASPQELRQHTREEDMIAILNHAT